MDSTTRQIRLWFFFSLCLHTVLFAETANDASQNNPDLLYLEQAQALRYSQPDSSLVLIAQSVEHLLQTGDTLHAVQALQTSASIYGNLANYKDAYDALWKALILADEAGLDREKALLYIDIGRHYSFYKRRDKALAYMGISLEINKPLIAEGKLEQYKLSRSYYAFCSTYRELNEFALARTYLDSCMQFFNQWSKPRDSSYARFELGCILVGEGKFAEALRTFRSMEASYETYDPSSLVLLYTYKADAYMGLGQHTQSESYYKRALEISAEYHMHIDFSALIHEKLSQLYLKQGDYRQAYQRLKTVKELDSTFFDSRSAGNRSLLEIQDAFREEHKAQEAIIRQQKLEQLEREEDVWFLERLILLVTILFMVTIGILFFGYMRAKYRTEKQVLQKEKELELQKANEVLEIKNKELAASALKLIEKDENLAMLKGKIKDANGAVDVNE